MKNTELKIKNGALPAPFVMFGYLLIVVGLVISIELWYVGVPLILVGLLPVSAKDWLLFNFENKTLYKYSTFWFFKKGEYINLSEIVDWIFNHITLV